MNFVEVKGKGEIRFTDDDIGCYIDAGGYWPNIKEQDRHRRRGLAVYVEALGHAELGQRLRNDVSPVFSDNEKEAIRVLREHTEEGLAWKLDFGCLHLCQEEGEREAVLIQDRWEESF